MTEVLTQPAPSEASGLALDRASHPKPMISSAQIARRIRRLGAASVRLAALLDRPARRQVEVTIDFTGFVIPDRFVIGYGLDYAGLYRELPHIYALT